MKNIFEEASLQFFVDRLLSAKDLHFFLWLIIGFGSNVRVSHQTAHKLFIMMELKYFGLDGRGATTRIMLHAANAEWKDITFDFPEWQTIKPTTPLGQVPTLRVDGTEFCQSVALQRYAALLAGFYPKDDPLKALIVDETMDVINECISKIPQANGTAEENKAARQEFQNTSMKKYFGLVESRIQQFGGETKDTICGILSVADVYLMKSVKFLQSGFYENIAIDFFKDYPGITTCVDHTADLEMIQSYYASLNSA